MQQAAEGRLGGDETYLQIEEVFFPRSPPLLSLLSPPRLSRNFYLLIRQRVAYWMWCMYKYMHHSQYATQRLFMQFRPSTAGMKPQFQTWHGFALKMLKHFNLKLKEHLCLSIMSD